MPRCGRSQLRNSDQNPSMVFTCTSHTPSPSSSRANSPRPWLTLLWSYPQRSCASPLRIIPSAQKLGTMLHLTTRWKGHCHGLTPCVLPTRSVGGHLALRYVASHGG